MNENLKITGAVKATITREDGTAEIFEFNNLVVTVGKNFIADRMVNNSTQMSHMAVGTSNTAPSVGQTALVAEIARVTLDSAVPTANQVVYTATFGAGVGTGVLAEAGTFNAGVAGTMLCRALFPSTINKTAGDILTVVWTITVN